MNYMNNVVSVLGNENDPGKVIVLDGKNSDINSLEWIFTRMK